jgi:WhiB family redox-sensing transcriptional regulator
MTARMPDSPDTPMLILAPTWPRRWQDAALCAQVGDDIFFPEKGGSTRDPKRVCRACPVRAECLEYALEHDERFGIWGGMSERERRRLKRVAS